MRTSVGQALANALAAWLRRSLSPDVTVYAHWPEPDVRLKGRVVSINPVGRRTRADAAGIWPTSKRTNISDTQATTTFQIGGIVQPVQLDVWARSQDGRDDLIAQFDDVLYAGIADTLNVPNSEQTIAGDPLRDGILLELGDGFGGSYGDYWFDDASIDDTPDSIQREEYRAILMGEARTAYTVTRTTSRILRATLKQQTSSLAKTPSPAVLPYDTTTLAHNPDPPPVVVVTHGKSST